MPATNPAHECKPESGDSFDRREAVFSTSQPGFPESRSPKPRHSTRPDDKKPWMATTATTTPAPPQAARTLAALLRELLSACFTEIWIQSHEPDEAARGITDLCHSENRRVESCEPTERPRTHSFF